MSSILEFVRNEGEKTFSENGALTSSLEKKYFNYECNGTTVCQIKTQVMCREVDRFHPFNEAKWQSERKECARCYKTNSRLLEDIYLKSA